MPRTRATLVLVAFLVLTAGCSALGGDGGCGPADSELQDLDTGADAVTVRGEVVETNDGAFVVDDSTGRAMVFSDASVSVGDCVTVTGQPGTGANDEVDYTFLEPDVTVEETAS